MVRGLRGRNTRVIRWLFVVPRRWNLPTRAPDPKGRPIRVGAAAAIALMAASVVMFAAHAPITAAADPPAAGNPIVTENLKSGRPLQDLAAFESMRRTFGHGESRFPDREVSSPRFASLDEVVGGVWTASPISGYAGADSINKGQAIDLYVSTLSPTFAMEVYRAGYYGGAGSRLITTISGLTGINQPIPTPDPATGLIEANWQKSYTLQTDQTWTTGVYLVKLIASSGQTQWVVFVVRDDGAAADIVFQVPTTTWQAYNYWGGKSLYHGYLADGDVRSYKVSFDRPYYSEDGAGEFFEGQYTAIRYLESAGYNVTYVTSQDTHSRPQVLAGRKMFWAGFHDEYWSRPMRTNLTSARDAGMGIAFLSANDIYWQIRFEPDSRGVANRTVVCYKSASLDPTSDPSVETVQWRQSPVNQPENAFLGSMYGATIGDWPWVVANASNWVYDGTGVANGDQIVGLVGIEFDYMWNNGLTPAGTVKLSDSPTSTANNQNGTVYTAASGAVVFNAGTQRWPQFLDNNEVYAKADSRVRKMTSNLIARMTAAGPTPRPPPPARPPARPRVRPRLRRPPGRSSAGGSSMRRRRGSTTVRP